MITSNRRIVERRHLIFYLTVVDLDSNQLLGYIVDISEGGIMLMSNQPIEVGEVFQLQVTLPGSGEYGENFSFQAQSIWSRQGPNEEIFDTGFKLIGTSKDQLSAIRHVIDELGFDHSKY
ncbi:PilZ domain-containing protein [Sulfidibacter corallicola]|uniref:PilZ domain-containing protein n=1 Tax=Sulfidibacter corallicola TaxID=2818388 RepID=A0A8A4TWQ7_SULCO|nr:PilZ domain-containing protein [Sulfidibacter corallicola]QTD53920.1 PilZ domain-containing protein [Sulfidibacter corallicola]